MVVEDYARDPLARIARTIVLVGGVLMIVSGILGIAVPAFGQPFLHWDFYLAALVTFALGFVAIILASSVCEYLWAVVLIIIGIVGGGVGGLLVLIGGAIGLIDSLA